MMYFEKPILIAGAPEKPAFTVPPPCTAFCPLVRLSPAARPIRAAATWHISSEGIECAQFRRDKITAMATDGVQRDAGALSPWPVHRHSERRGRQLASSSAGGCAAARDRAGADDGVADKDGHGDYAIRGGWQHGHHGPPRQPE